MLMILRAVLFSLATLALAASAAEPLAGRSEHLDEISRELLQALGASEKKCPPSVTLYASVPIHICGKLPKSWRERPDLLLEAVEKFLADRGACAPGREGDPGWLEADGSYRRGFEVQTELVTIEVKPNGRRISISYHGVFPSCVDDSPPPVSACTQGLEGASVIARVPPEIPRTLDAPLAMPAVVQVQAVIDRSGLVRAVCVQFVNRKHKGFEEAALNSIREWKYSPAKLDGEPIEITTTVIINWEGHPDWKFAR